MKVFEFEFEGLKDWVAAKSKKEAVGFYQFFIGETDLEGFRIKQLTDNEIETSYVLDINEPEPDEDDTYNEQDYSCGYKIQESFKDAVKKLNEPAIIATSEFV